MSEESNINTSEDPGHTRNGNTRLGRHHHFPDLLGGILFICVGIILILNNFSVIPWAIWSYLIDFWPIAFILIGLDLISANSIFLKFITTIVGVFLIAFIIVYSYCTVSYSFRNFMFKSFPAWQKIYQAIPGAVQNELHPSPTKTFHVPFDSDYYYSN